MGGEILITAHQSQDRAEIDDRSAANVQQILDAKFAAEKNDGLIGGDYRVPAFEGAVCCRTVAQLPSADARGIEHAVQTASPVDNRGDSRLQISLASNIAPDEQCCSTNPRPARSRCWRR